MPNGIAHRVCGGAADFNCGLHQDTATTELVRGPFNGPYFMVRVAPHLDGARLARACREQAESLMLQRREAGLIPQACRRLEGRNERIRFFARSRTCTALKAGSGGIS